MTTNHSIAQPTKQPIKNNHNNASFEFIALMALTMSIGALATDTLLPALGVIANNFDVQTTSQKQLLVTMVFLGMGCGQMFAGALSDSLGRKPIVYVGFVIFILASLMSVVAGSYEMLVLSRFLQGVGLSSPRTISTAIIRDSYSGNYMAKIMSFISMTFLIVPAVSPMLGSALLSVSGWQSIFYMQAGIALVALVWFALRQPETLAVENRAQLNRHIFINSIKVFFAERRSVIYTVAMGFAFGGFMTFLSAGESILIGQYGKEAEFPYLFACIALAMGISMMVNAKLVTKYGMAKMSAFGGVCFLIFPTMYLLLCTMTGSLTSNPSLYLFMAFMMLQVFAVGFVFGNLTALSLEPLGKIAGMATAISGLLSTTIGVTYAGVVGSFIDTTALPLVLGFFGAGVALMICLWLGHSLDSRRG